MMAEEKKGYATITYQKRFYDKHFDWLKETKTLYNKVVKHYYFLLADFPELLELSNFNLMRKLEIMTVGTKEMKKAGQKASYPLLNIPNIPLYFRRAAINSAISLIRNYQTISVPLPMVDSFFLSPVYYKGMYKEWKENTILLKVYTKEKWVWNQYHFHGRSLPKEADLLSPIIRIEKKQAYLQIPVKRTVKDIRTIKERMKTERNILALSFPGNDSIAVGAVLTREGVFEKAVFFQGGLERKAKCNIWKRKLERQKGKKAYSRKKIEQINDFYAHLVSRRIVNFCMEHKIYVIAVPNYQKAIDFSKKRYLKTNNFEWIGRRVIRYLKYKAFLEGILVSKVPVVHLTDRCSECGEKIKRYNEGHRASTQYLGGQLFLCPNGHQGNTGLNTAKNVGRRFLSYYPKEEDFNKIRWGIIYNIQQTIDSINFAVQYNIQNKKDKDFVHA